MNRVHRIMHQLNELRSGFRHAPIGSLLVELERAKDTTALYLLSNGSVVEEIADELQTMPIQR